MRGKRGTPTRRWLVPWLLLPAMAAAQTAPEPYTLPPSAPPPPSVAAPIPLEGQHPSTPPPGTEPHPVWTPPPVPVDPTVHRHLGFFFRLDIGVGYLNSSTPSRSASGVAAPFGLAIGGAVTENLILAAEAWASATSPSVTENGTTVNTGTSGLAVGALGLNVTYYLMPANIYFSLTPSFTALGLSGNFYGGSFAEVDSHSGFGMKFAAGKEWWVSDHWGVGLAVEFIFSTNKDSGTNPPTWTTIGGGLKFSATYN